MKVVFFTNASENIAAVRYRVIRFAEMLREREGWTCVVCTPSPLSTWQRWYEDRPRWSKLVYLLYVLLRRLAQMRHVPGADAVYFRGPLYPYGPPLLERLARLLNRRLVFDIDDAVWVRPAYVRSRFLRLVDHDWLWKMCRMSVHGVVGNTYLRDQVAPHHSALTVVPTPVDMARHTPKSYADAPAGPVLLGWTGLYSNLGYFEVIDSVLQRLAREHDIALLVATGRPYTLDGVRVINERWELAHEIRYLQQPDIGLMPLVDSERARGKCAYKAMQYMAVGTPCVVSPVGMNADVIEDGVTGFLAGTPDEWHDKLTRLIVDPALRAPMGHAARAHMQARYSHEALYPALKAALEAAARA